MLMQRCAPLNLSLHTASNRAWQCVVAMERSPITQPGWRACSHEVADGEVFTLYSKPWAPQLCLHGASLIEWQRPVTEYA